MAALTENTAPDRRTGHQVELPVKTAIHIYKGGLIAVDATGYCLPAADAANHVVIGHAIEEADNSSGASGDLRLVVNRDPIALDNSATNAVTNAYTGKVVYVEDDHTVSTSGGTNSVKAGICLGVDPDSGKVWVDPKFKS